MNADASWRDSLRRQNTYYLSLIGTLLVLAVGIFLLAQHFGQLRLIFTNLVPWAVTLWALSKLVAGRICRKAGISLERRDTETLGPFRNSASGEPLSEVMHKRGADAYIMPVCCTGLIYCFTSFLFECPCPLNIAVRVPLIAITGACAIFSWKNALKPEYRVNETAISRCDSLGFNFRSIRWQDVSSCESIQEHDALGKVIEDSLVFKGPDGKNLLTISSRMPRTDSATVNWNRLIDFVRAKQVERAPGPFLIQNAEADAFGGQNSLKHSV